MIRFKQALFILPAATALQACSGSPASVGDVTEKLRGEFSDDGYEVTWLNVTEKKEPGTFKAIVDRIKGGDPETEETMICNVSATTNSSSWTCQTAKPSIMIQAAEMLKKDYASRQINVREYNLRRTGHGNDFAGYFVLATPNGQQQSRIPCRGSQDGTDFKIDCDPSYGEDGGGAKEEPGSVT
jgi:hypothetical protein